MNKKQLVLVDDREPGSTAFDLKQYFDVQTMRLTVGDIVIPGTPSCVIERKAPLDFLSSIADGRLVSQLSNMLEITPTPIFIIDGDVKADRKEKVVADGQSTRWFYWSYQNMIASLQLAGAIVIHVPNRLFGTAVWRVYQWHQKDSHMTVRRVPSTGLKTTFSQQLDLLSQVPGIGTDKAELLLDTFGNLWNVLSNIPDWDKVPGIGPKTIEKVTHFFDYSRQVE